MKWKILSAKSLAFLFLFLSCLAQTINAQQKVDLKALKDLIAKNAAKIVLSTDDIDNSRISDAYFDKQSGLMLVYLQQTYKGIDVHNSIQTIAFKNDKVVSVAGMRVPKMELRANTQNALPGLSAVDAVKATVSHLKLTMPSFIVPLKTNDPKLIEFDDLGISSVPVKAKQVWFAGKESKDVRLSWQIEIQPNKMPDYWLVNVDAFNGNILHKYNLNVSCNWGTPQQRSGEFYENKNFEQQEQTREIAAVNSAQYRVVPYPAESPSHPGGTPAVHVNPWELSPAGSDATTLKWNDNGTTTYEITQGNNVLAQEDRNGNNGTGARGLSKTAAPDLTFDYLPNLAITPTDSLNQGFALTNLFYWNNIVHDISYLYGFDEVAGNFQANNQGRGGSQNDYVLADAQDGSGSDNADFSTPADGSRPRMQMYLFSGAPQLDGDLDNGVISHEYTHGISNRLTGGPSNTSCLNNDEQMGEGWSDFNALMVTTNWATAQVTDGTKARPLGTYVLDELPSGGGIRNYPYSTDMNIDPQTYVGLPSEAHDLGEVWCTVLWDMTWNIIQMDGINPNLFNATGTGGNTVALKLVIEGMKLQPCSPGFIDGRDGILKADTLLYGGKYSCAIWDAFARRGMGLYASQGSSSTVGDETADFTPASGALVVKHSNKDSAAQGEQITYTFEVKTRICGGISDYKIVDTLSTQVSYVSGGTYNAGNRAVTFSGINVAPGETQNINLVVMVNNGTYFPTNEYVNEIVPQATISADWTNVSTTSTEWVVGTNRSYSGPNSFYANDAATVSDEALETTNSYLLEGASSLSFWHYYNTEAGYDGGVVEISTDGGTIWQDLGQYMIENGYNASISPDDGSYIAGRNAFAGSSGGFFIHTTVNLSSFAGQNVKIRFLFASDAGISGDGWYIDNILLKSEAIIYNEAQLFDNANGEQGSSDTLTVITNSVLPVTWGNFTAEKQGSNALLKWQTLQEFNTAKFIVERSANGTNFFDVGSLPAAGNSSHTSNYNFTDKVPLDGINYYRLRQVDKDGKFTWSEIRSLTFSGLNGLISISPNPAKDKISVIINGNTRAVQIFLTNSFGQQIKTYQMNGQIMQFNLPRLAAGVYYITITGEGISSKHKLLIQ